MKTLKKMPLASKDKETIRNCLYDSNNYKEPFVLDLPNIINHMTIVWSYYLIELYKIQTIKSKHKKNIIDQGLTTITHIFMFILINTNNLEMAIINSQHGGDFYNEFIRQLTDEITFPLNLTTNDAIMFAYKKTIFDINRNYSKNKNSINQTTNNIDIYNQLNNITNIYKLMVYHMHDIINNNSNNNSNNTTNNINNDIILLIKKISYIPQCLTVISNYTTNYFANSKFNSHDFINDMNIYLDKIVSNGESIIV